MSLLSAQAIRGEIESRRLVIDPVPRPLDYDSDAVDVHLGSDVYIWRSPAGKATLTIPLWRGLKGEGPFVYREFASENLVKVEPDPDGIVTLRPGTCYLAGQLTFWRVEQPLAESDIPTQQFSNQQTARG